MECEGDDYKFMNTAYGTPGIYYDTLSNTIGWDSIIYTIEFDYYESDTIEIVGDLVLCDNETIQLSIGSFAIKEYH